jgi:hypothetical protein
MTAIRERYPAKVVAANTTTIILGQSLGGFLCKTAGTISVVNSRGTTVVDAIPVLAGVYYPLPIFVGDANRATFTTAGGASGTLMG